MKYILKFDESLLLDFNDKVKYYNEIATNLGDKLHFEFWDKIDYIKKYPLHHPIKYKQIRIANLKVFPFTIILMLKMI